MSKKVLALVAGLLVTATALAAATHLRPGHPDQYVVQRGDTLWTLAARFLSRPWYWPEIWQANPQAYNPHLIYPGDVLNLAYDNGPRLRLAPGVHVGERPIPAIPLAALAPYLRDLRVIDPDALARSPYVMAFEENRLRGTPGQYLYARREHAEPGTQYIVVRPTHVFRAFGPSGADEHRLAHDVESNAEMVSHGWWREDFRNDGYRHRGANRGVEVRVIGSAEVLRQGDPATLLLTDSHLEIRKGDRLLPATGPDYDPYFYPHAPASAPQDGRVIALADGLHAVGYDVVALSVGSSDGVDNGTTFAIMRPGEFTHDDVISNPFQRSLGHNLTLPDEQIGHVMVFRAFDRVSYGLIMDASSQVVPGYRLALPD